ncbi:MAG: hypothetical protein KJ958_10500 [Gammaproteobacteria bacterium]|nr:hypothetical protein [Gammaproteobacteria bacterium]MBU1979585.1 hypothetical protein [Gammaproteobacteria bacterium]
MKKQTLVTLAIGSAFTVGALIPVAHATSDNPFGASKLKSGYQLAEADTKMKDGKCGEAKCGADKKAEKKTDAKCGADKKTDAKCGADKKVDAKCGADKKSDAKCGANKM